MAKKGVGVKKKAEVEKPEKKGLKIIGFIFGLFAILTCGIPIFNIISIIIAIIGLVFSIIASKRTEKKGLAIAGIILNIIAICIGLIVLLIAGSILLFMGFLGNSGNLTYINYSIGQKISSGNMSLIVLSADKSSQIKNSQGQIIPLETSGYFLSIKINLENMDSETRTYSGDPFVVIDSQGRTFYALSDAEKYYSNAIGAGTQVQPGVLFNGIKIFEVPKDSTGLKLKMALNNKEGAYVILGK